MCWLVGAAQHRCMTTTPADAAAAVLQNPVLPDGDDERFVGFGVMGLPFAGGHYLALRHFPATTFSPGYRSVWHRDPDGIWTFYATTPGPQSCARYFSSATRAGPGAVRYRHRVGHPVVAIRRHHGTARMGDRPARNLIDAADERDRPPAAGRRVDQPAGAGRYRPSGRTDVGRGTGPSCPGPRRTASDSGSLPRGCGLWPGRVRYCAAWTSDRSGSLREQARLEGFRPPQRGLFVVGSGHFETFDPSRHRAVERRGQ